MVVAGARERAGATARSMVGQIRGRTLSMLCWWCRRGFVEDSRVRRRWRMAGVFGIRSYGIEVEAVSHR